MMRQSHLLTAVVIIGGISLGGGCKEKGQSPSGGAGMGMGQLLSNLGHADAEERLQAANELAKQEVQELQKARPALEQAFKAETDERVRGALEKVLNRTKRRRKTR